MNKTIFTGIKPTSNQIHIWNYFGAVKPLFDTLEEHPDATVYFMIASMHALTTVHDGEKIAQDTKAFVKLYLAMMRNAWLEDDALCIFSSPDIPGHAQLTRVIQCITNMWFMERMHAYKDAAAKGKAWEVSVWTFCYPILMAIDILLYNTTHVPVWKDQKQHVEYTRDIAQSFNKKFWETFVLPKSMINEDVATVPGTDGRKMSKSYNNYIGLLEDEKTIRKKIARIPTAALWIDDPKDPDSCNLYALQKLFVTEAEDTAIRKEYTQGWLSYKDAKQRLADTIRNFVQPIQKEYNTIEDAYVIELLERNAQQCNAVAEKKVAEVYKKVWFLIE